MISPYLIALSLAWVAYSPASAPNDNNDAQIRDRYLNTVLKNPRHGPALEKLYQSALQTDGVDALIAEIRKQAPERSESTSRTLIGLLEEIRGRDEEAIAALQQAVQADKRNYYAWYSHGLILLHRNDYKSAAESLLHALEADPPQDDAIEIRKTLGRCYLRNREIEKAREAWSNLARIAPDDPLTLEELTTLLVEEEQWEEAIIYYEQLRALYKDRPYQAVLCIIAMGNAEARRGRFPDAVTRYEEALSQAAPDSWLAAEIRSRIQELFRKRNDLQGLVDYYESKVKGKNSNDVQMMTALAQMLAELDRGKESREWYEKALSLAPKDEAVRLSYVRLLESDKDYPAAIRQYEQLLEQKPKEAAYLEALGTLQLKQRRDQETERAARTLWERIAQANPEDPATMTQVAEIFRKHDLNEDATRYFERAIELAPTVGQYREYYGEFLVKTKQRDKALDAFRAMAAGPQRSVESLMRLASVLDHFQFTPEAIAAAREAVALKADHFDARMLLIKLLSVGDAFDEALTELQAAEKLAPNEYFAEQVVDDRIRLLNRFNRLQEAFEERSAALARNPSAEAAAWAECAKMALALARIEAASECVKNALGRSPDNVSLWELSLRICSRASDEEGYGRALKRLIELAPQNRVEYFQQLARQFARLGDSGEAVKAAEEVISCSPDNPAGYELLASLCERFGMVDRSLDILRKAVRVNPKSIDLRMLYGRRLDRGGDADAAVEQYWEAYEAQEQIEDKLVVIRALADTYYCSGKFDQLIERLKRRHRLAGDDWVPALSLAEAYRHIEDFSKARQTLLSLLASRPKDASLLSQLVGLSQSEGLQEEAVRYMQQLVDLEPSQKNLLRLGELLLVLERQDDAIVAWRRAAGAAKDSPRVLADVVGRLLQGQLYQAAIDLMSDEVARHPEDWELGYRYGLALLGAERIEEAERVWLRIADLPDLPPIQEKSKPKPKDPSPASYALSYWSQIPPEIARMQKMFQLRYQLSNRFRSSQQGVFVPPDLETARLAAWYQHCQIARKNTLFESIVTSLKKENTAQAWWRLVATFGMEERWGPEIQQAAKNLCAVAPDDVAAKVARLQILLDSRGRQGTEVPFDETKTLYETLTSARPDLAGYLAPGWLSYLKQAGKKDEITAHVQQIARREYSDVREITMAINAAIQAEDLDTALKLLTRSEKQFGETVRQSGTSWASWSYVYASVARLAIQKDQPRQAADSLGRYLRLSRPVSTRITQSWSPYYSRYGSAGTVDSFPNSTVYYDSNRLRTLDECFRLARGEGSSAGPSPASRPTSGASPSLRPATQKSSDDGRPQADSPLLVAIRSMWTAELDSENEEDRVYAHLALAYFDWWSERREEAARHIAAAGKLRPWDLSLRMSLAQLRYNLDDKKGALEALSAIQQPYHPLYKPAQQLALRAADDLGDTDTAKTAALRLFNMRLSSQEQLQLAATLRQLGLGQKAEQLEQRVRALSSQDLSQLVELMRQQQSRGAKKEAAELAKQVLRHLGQATMNEEYYRESSLRVLRESGDLDGLIEAAEKQRAANPNSVRVLVDLWYYYAAKGEYGKARERAEEALNLRPDDMRLRFQYAQALQRNKQIDAAMEQLQIILKKAPGTLLGGRSWDVINAFRQAGQLAKFAQMVAKEDWDRIARNAGIDPHQLSSTLIDIAQQLEREKQEEVLPFLDKLNDYIAADGQTDWRLPQVARIRYLALKKAGRSWEALRYIVAFCKTFDGFPLTPPAAVTAEERDRPLGVKTRSAELLTSVHGWSHPDGSPSGLVTDVLDAAGEFKQLEGMREYVEKKLVEDPKNLETNVWLAMINARLGRFDEVRPAVSGLLDMAAQNRSTYYPILWLDEAIKNTKELLPQSVQCCEYILTQDQKDQNRGISFLLYYRMAERYARAGQLEESRTFFHKLATLNPPPYYSSTSLEDEKQRYMFYAAQGMEKSGLYADAYALASKLAGRTAPQGRGDYEIREAKRLVERIAREHPEIGLAVTAVAVPVAENTIQVAWSATAGDKEGAAQRNGGGNVWNAVRTLLTGGKDVASHQHTRAAAFSVQADMFKGYRAEIQVAVSETGEFRKLAEVPADAQHYNHSGLPANKLLWCRVVIRDADGRVAAVSETVPVTAGRNLVPDGGMEQMTPVLIPLSPTDEKQPWIPLNPEKKPCKGTLAISEPGRPFSSGTHCLVADASDGPLVIGTRPIPADPTKSYLIGGWLRAMDQAASWGRLSLDENAQPLVMSETAWAEAGPRWAFAVQRLTQDSSLKVTPGQILKRTSQGAAGMPNQQKYLHVGFQADRSAAFDDGFLIEYTPADAAAIASLPAVDNPVLQTDAASKLAQHLAEHLAAQEPTSLLTAVPIAENAIQLIWSTQPKVLDGKTRDDAVRVRAIRQPGLFKACQAEIQVSASPYGRYRVVATVPADSQTYIHKDVPPNTLLWYRIGLRDSSGRIIVMSRPIASAAGKNLFPDGNVEESPLGPVVADPNNANQIWQPLDMNFRPRDGLSITKGSRPFCDGKRCLTAENTRGVNVDQMLVVRGQEVPADPNKKYLYGAWVRVESSNVAVGRVALDAAHQPVLASEAWGATAAQTTDWSCITQRICLDSSLRPQPQVPPTLYEMDRTNLMPANQQYLMAGLMVGEKALIDDTFLVEYHLAEEASLASLAHAEPSGLDPTAAKQFRELAAAVDELSKPFPLLTVVPISESSVQILWSAQPKESALKTGRNNVTAVRVAEQRRVFKPYQVEIHISTSETGEYRLLASVPAESQNYVHENVPPNALLWYRIVLRDQNGNAAAVSQVVAAAAGKNLIPDAAIEQMPTGTVALNAANPTQTWQPLDLNLKPREGLAVIEESRPFSRGKRCLIGTNTKGMDIRDALLVQSLPASAPPDRKYLYGGWIRADEPQGIALGRVALDKTQAPVLVSEAVTQTKKLPDWACVVQRITGNPELRPEPAVPPTMYMDTQPADQMPANQAFLAIGFAVGGKGAMDDVFLVEYYVADESTLTSYPPAKAIEIDIKAARDFEKALGNADTPPTPIVVK